MALLVGVLLAFTEGLMATAVGLDRDRAFYPTVTIAIASCYALFAVMGASTQALVLESLVGSVFLAVAVVSFRSSDGSRLLGVAVEDAVDARKEDMMKKNDTSRKAESPARLIDARIKELGDWRAETLSRIRTLIKEADPDVVEEWRWVKATNPGTPVWSHDGIICTGESYKSTVKLTFARGLR